MELLGGLRLHGGGRTVTEFETRKIASLLAYLGFHGSRPITRERLAGLLWPDSDPVAAATSLRSALYRLGRIVPSGELLQASRTTVALHPHVAVDVREFFAAYADAAAADAEDEEIVALSRAVATYGGPLLDGFLDEWVLPEQLRLEELALDAHLRLGHAREIAGEFEEALHILRATLPINPLHEGARTAIMRCYARLGDRGQATKEYDDLRRLLRVELDLDPSRSTRVLAERIAAGELDPEEAPQAGGDEIARLLEWQLRRDPPSASALLSSMSDYWYIYRNSPEGLQMVRRVLASGRPEEASDPLTKSRLLHLGGRLAYIQSRYQEAAEFFRTTIELLRDGPDEKLMGALMSYAFSLRENGDVEGAKSVLAEAVHVSARVPDGLGLIRFRANLGGMLCHDLRVEEGVKLYREMAAAARERGEYWTETVCLQNLAVFDEEDPEESLRCGQEGLQGARTLGDLSLVAFGRYSLAHALMRVGKLEEAKLECEGAIRLARSRDLPRIVALALELQAEVAHGRGDPESARAHLEAATAERLRIRAVRSEYEARKYSRLESLLKDD